MSDLIEGLVRRYEGGGMTRRELVVALSALVVARSAPAAARPRRRTPSPSPSPP